MADPDTTSSGLLYVPKTAKERVDQGVVKYIGPDVEHVKVGDYVIFSGYSGQDVYIGSDGTDEAEVLVVLDEEYIISTINLPDDSISSLYHKSPIDLSLIHSSILNACPNATPTEIRELTRLIVSPPHFYNATQRTAVESIAFHNREIPNSVRLKDRTQGLDKSIKVKRGV